MIPKKEEKGKTTRRKEVAAYENHELLFQTSYSRIWHTIQVKGKFHHSWNRDSNSI